MLAHDVPHSTNLQSVKGTAGTLSLLRSLLE